LRDLVSADRHAATAGHPAAHAFDVCVGRRLGWDMQRRHELILDCGASWRGLWARWPS